MIELSYNDYDIDAFTQHVRQLDTVRSRIEKLLQEEVLGGESTQLHRTNAELRLAKARLALAQKDYDAVIEHMDAAISEWTKVEKVLENKREFGMVTLELLLAAEKSVTDARLEKNSMQRKIQFLQAQR